VTRNAECIGHPHSTLPGCGWSGERSPNMQMTRAPGNLWDRRVFTNEFIEAVSAKPCPSCQGIVMPIETNDVVWPSHWPASGRP
jgi:hypothetical protein